jgi:hypothetical protein
MNENTEDKLLLQAWSDFCDSLKAMGRIPFREMAPGTPVDRTAGFQQILRNLSLSMDFEYEYKNPKFPELARYFSPTRKQGGDNSDCCYVGAQVNGTDTYRITGNRGSSRYFSVTAVETGDTPWGGKVCNALFGDQIETEEDGSFELIVSPDPHPGNWLQTTPNTFRITFRQYFADWENEKPMKARIERLGAGNEVPDVLSPQAFAEGLSRVSNWLEESIEYWPAMLEKWKPTPNKFMSYWQLEDKGIDATPGGDPLVCYWQLPKDEALIIRVQPADCLYWSVEFGNYYWETVDYRYRLSNTNCHYATLQDDGELIVVVSHTDPGVPNWLDCSGHSEGYVTYRWMMSEHHPVPVAEQVKLSELADKLPGDIKRVDADWRREQLATRRRGVNQRFGY